MHVSLKGKDGNNSSGGAYFTFPANLNLSGADIWGYINVPSHFANDSSPVILRPFVQSSNGKFQYGQWTKIAQNDWWRKISPDRLIGNLHAYKLTKATEGMAGYYTEPGFEPEEVVAIGIQIETRGEKEFEGDVGINLGITNLPPQTNYQRDKRKGYIPKTVSTPMQTITPASISTPTPKPVVNAEDELYRYVSDVRNMTVPL
jgi:hypothetical protein